MGERPGQENESTGPVETAFATSARGNSPAFGFSISITVSYGAVQTLNGSPRVLDLLLFGVGAALGVAVMQALISRGFRRRVGVVHAEVMMLGTALNAFSVLAAVGAAIGMAELAEGWAAWFFGAFVVGVVYLLVEGLENLLAEWIQRKRGDPEAEEPVEEE